MRIRRVVALRISRARRRQSGAALRLPVDWSALSLAQAGRDDLFRLGVLAALDMPYDPADDAVGGVLDWDQVGRLELDQEPE